MKIVFTDGDFTECWDGVFFKKLSGYPNITEWEIQNVLDFIAYENAHGRECIFEEQGSIYQKIMETRNSGKKSRVPVPKKIEECTACPKYRGCMTDFVCHTSSVENAVKILGCGSLLSAVKARGESAEKLMKEKRNAAHDPADYFEYVMFSWGNCQAGDRLVMERKLGRFPDEEDLGRYFTPGVRYYFRYDELVRHPGAVFDGVLPLKVKDEVVLRDWVYAITVPEPERNVIENTVPHELKDRVYYIKNDCRDIWEWSEKVYEFIKGL